MIVGSDLDFTAGSGLNVMYAEDALLHSGTEDLLCVYVLEARALMLD